MWPYWLMFMFPAITALLQPTRAWVLRPKRQIWQLEFSWTLLIVFWTLILGFRVEVGGDWINYARHLQSVATQSFDEILERPEVGYWLVMRLAADSSLGIFTANLIFGFIFSAGLVVFCRSQPRPWLALTIAVPYTVIVLGMGYTRQGVALGLGMIGLVALERRQTLTFVIFVALGALFHKSALVLIPLGMMAVPGKKKIWTLTWVGAMGVVLYDALLRSSVDALTANYIDAEYQSEGALVRVMMNVLPAVILLMKQKRFQWTQSEGNLWTLIAWLALAAAAVLPLSPSSTAVDRVALYLIPLQLYVFSRLPDLWDHESRRRQKMVVAVVAYYAMVQFVWLVFAKHSFAWLPYRFYPLEAVF